MQRYWIIGGEFHSLSFERLIDGTARVIGPFASRGEAEQAWRDVSDEHRHKCAVRFAITEERLAA